MKTYKYLLGLGVAAMSLSSCSNDAIDAPDTPQVADKDMTRYIALSISSNNPKSRAGGVPETFEDGTGAESRIQSCYLVFYDAEKNPIGEIVNVGTDFKDVDLTDDITVEQKKAKGKVVEISIPKGQVMPSYVMCYLNPRSTNLLFQPLTTLETTTRDGFDNNLTGESFAFSMSNAVYYDGVTDNSYAARPAYINNGNTPETQLIFDNKTDAETALTNGTNLIKVYVERYAARVALQQAAADITITGYELPMPVFNAEGQLVAPTETNPAPVITLNFQPVGWEVNSTNTETFITKIFRQQAGLGQIGGSQEPYTTINTNLGNPGRAWEWNNVAYHRCYWACSPAYYTDKFPEVASDIETGNYPLEYHSYKGIADMPVAATGNVRADQIRWAQKRYKMESTMGTTCFNSNNPAASIPSLLITGQYTFDEKHTLDGKEATFFTYNPHSNDKPYILAATNTDGSASITGCTTMKDMFLHVSSTLFYQKAGSTKYFPVNYSNRQDVADAFVVTRPSDNVLKIIAGSAEGTKINLAARKVTLQIADLTKLPSGTTLYIASGSGLRPVVTGTATAEQYTIDHANAIIANDVKYADQYTEGMAYFTKPIVHLGFYAGTNPNAETAANGVSTPANTLKSDIDWSKVRIGDFGLVRNHAYNLSVSKIAGLGIAVRDEEDPIVPPVETDQYYMAMQVNILQWAIVPTQNIEF